MYVNFYITIHKNDFKYIGLDLFEETNLDNQNEIIPNTNFLNPLKNIYFKVYIKKQNPYTA